MEKTFQEIQKIFEDGKEDYIHMGGGSSTFFSQDDFSSPSSEESLSIERSGEKFGIKDPEVFYFVWLLNGHSNLTINEGIKRMWEESSLEETNSDVLNEFFGDLYYEYKPPLHYGHQFSKFFIVHRPDLDWSCKELIIETQGSKEGTGEFIHVRWETSA